MLRISLFLLFVLVSVRVVGQSNTSVISFFEEGKKMVLPDSVNHKLAQNPKTPTEILSEWLASNGFLNAQVTLETDSVLQIDRGCLFNISTIRLKYSGEIDSTVIQEIGVNYSDAFLTNKIHEILHTLSFDGFPFAKAEISSFQPDKQTCQVEIDLDVFTGKKFTTADIYFSGLQTNSQAYIRKISGFNPAQTVTPDYVQFLHSNLSGSELFNEVKEGQLFLRDGEPILIFEVEERTLNHFDGLLGYVPDAAGKGQIVGDVELSIWNVLAQGNGFDFRYQRLKPETSQLNVGVSQNWFGDIPIGASAGFQLYQNDTTYQSRNFLLDGYYQLSPGFKLISGIDFQNTTSGNGTFALDEPDGRKRTAHLGFQYSKLDRYDVPTTGSSVRLTFGIANKDLADDSSTAFTQKMLKFSAKNYIPIFQNSVIATSLHLFLLESDKVTVHDLIRFGGANSLRGYAEQQFRAGTLVWGDVEYRFLTGSSSYLFVFGAAGGYQRPKLLTEADHTFAITDYLFSTGFGLSYKTKIGRLKFAYAISPEESISNGKIHFGIRTEL